MSLNTWKTISAKLDDAFYSALFRHLPRRFPRTLRLGVLHCQFTAQQSGFALLFLIGLNIFLPFVSSTHFLDQFSLFFVLLPAMLAVVYGQSLQGWHHIRDIPNPLQLPLNHTERFVAFQFSLLIYWVLAIALIALSGLLGHWSNRLLVSLPKVALGPSTVYGMYRIAGTWVFLQQLLVLLIGGHILINYACVIGASSRRYTVFKALAGLILFLYLFSIYVENAPGSHIFSFSWSDNSAPHPVAWASFILTDLVLLGLQFFSMKRIKAY